MQLQALTRAPLRLRGEDEWGRGNFGAPRGDHTHRGIDIIVSPGDDIFAPLDGEIVRTAIPYDDDERFSGILIRGLQTWHGYEIKIFYMQCAAPPGHVNAGEFIGKAQSIALRYPGITNHIHVELWKDGVVIDPTPFLRSKEAS